MDRWSFHRMSHQDMGAVRPYSFEMLLCVYDVTFSAASARICGPAIGKCRFPAMFVFWRLGIVALCPITTSNLAAYTIRDGTRECFKKAHVICFAQAWQKHENTTPTFHYKTISCTESLGWNPNTSASGIWTLIGMRLPLTQSGVWV